MEIKGKVHCFFEQSGTFKNEFIKLGIPAEDYDIQNNFGQTDHVIDLFAEIEKAYEGGASIFDTITNEDLIMAFFPCIYFETIQQLFFSLNKNDFRKKTLAYKIDYALKRLDKRTEFHKLLYKFTSICSSQDIKLIIENPATPPNYLITGQNFLPPTYIDKDRTRRGDFFKKPTAFWYINCEPTHGFTKQQIDEGKIKRIDQCSGSDVAGLCSEERSMISPDYARNFICDNILGITQRNIDKQTSIFDFLTE